MKNRRKIVKEAVVLLITAVMIFTTISVTANTSDVKKVVKSYENLDLKISGSHNILTINQGVFSDDFESYEDFVLDFPPWTQFDGDGASTYGFEEYEFPNEYYEGSYIIFNPGQCDPPLDDPPHSGDKYAACFNAVVPDENDDWLFTPQLSLVESGDVSFWAKRGSEQYEPDLFQVGVSITDTDPSNFLMISGVEEPPTDWTEYSYNLDDFIGEEIYIGIHCVSYDSFWLGIDDFSVTGVDYTLDPDLQCQGELHFGNVTAGDTVEGSFTVKNVGGGLLDWIITDQPSWGSWIFNPSEGDDLEPGPGVTVQVTVVAPEQSNEYFGTILIENKEDSNDFCTIDVSMRTPRSKFIQSPFLNLLENHPILFQIFQRIFQRLGLQ